MRRSEVQAEIEREPFMPIRLHLVSGKVIDVTSPGMAWMLDRAVLVFQEERGRDARYDVVSILNVERIEQV
jgi:hypothetical protein